MNTLFWSVRWLQGHSLDKLVAHLFGAGLSRARKRIVHEALTDLRCVADISGALTMPILIVYLYLLYLLIEVVLLLEVEDSHIWQLPSTGKILS